MPAGDKRQEDTHRGGHTHTHKTRSVRIEFEVFFCHMPPVPKSTMKSLEEYWKDQCPTLDSDERWILLLARRGFPATLLDDPEFRDLTKTKISRNCVPKMMEDLSKKLMDAAFSFVKEGTLAIDVGTVHRRFLAFVFVTKGKSIFLKLREDAEAGGVLTIEAV